MEYAMRVSYYNQTTGRLIAHGNDIYEGKIKVGDQISPFNSPKGRVRWQVAYLERLDPETLHVYVNDYGFIQE
jgi:hypothetical protein